LKQSQRPPLSDHLRDLYELLETLEIDATDTTRVDRARRFLYKRIQEVGMSEWNL
jgi:hypothetical protein